MRFTLEDTKRVQEGCATILERGELLGDNGLCYDLAHYCGFYWDYPFTPYDILNSVRRDSAGNAALGCYIGGDDYVGLLTEERVLLCMIICALPAKVFNEMVNAGVLE